MKRYLRTDMEAELGELYEPLDLLETAHAILWDEFDPSHKRGDKDQPDDVKRLLRNIRKVFAKHGLAISGFEGNEETV